MSDHRWIKKGLGLLSLSAMLLFTGCSGNEKKTEEPEIAEITADETAVKEMKRIAGDSEELTVWSAYWDCEDDIETLEESMDDIDQISLFEAYCKDGELMIPDVTKRMLKKIRRREILQDKTVFLSVVNDVEKNGKTVQKDTEILKEWMGDEESAQTHAEELVRLAADNGFDGIEVDYEKIRSDMNLWKNFIDFEKRLLEEAGKGQLQVRIVLEPGTPVDELDFPNCMKSSKIFRMFLLRFQMAALTGRAVRTVRCRKNALRLKNCRKNIKQHQSVMQTVVRCILCTKKAIHSMKCGMRMRKHLEYGQRNSTHFQAER